jgi:hypothetical protein
MEQLELYEKWLANEREILPLVEKLLPLLDTRHSLEAKDPRLGLLRDRRTYPGEPAPPKMSSVELLGLRPTTLMVGTGEPLVGLPDRQLPTQDRALKAMTKAAKNKKKHEKEKARKKAKKAKEEKKDTMEEEKTSDVPPSEN